MNGKIYCITNTVNGMKYIGQTWGDVNTHFNNYVSQANSGNLTTPLGIALRTYGSFAFRVEMLRMGIVNQHTLDNLESHYIALYGTLQPYGYNVRP